MFRRILVPLDGSDCAERAIPVAVQVARTFGSSLIFTRVVLPPLEPSRYGKYHASAWEHAVYEKQRAEAASYLAGMLIGHGSELAGIEAEMGMATGVTIPAIFSLARSQETDLMVLCSHGERGLKRWLFGSVAQEAIRRSPVPTLILHNHPRTFSVLRPGRPLRALVALDGSVHAEVALEPTAHLIAELAAPAHGMLHLLHVVDLPQSSGKWRSHAFISPALREQARKEAETYLKTLVTFLHCGPLAALKLTVTWSVVVSTNVAGTIIAQAEQSGYCDLIAMATYGRRGLNRFMMGSITEQVLDHTGLPLLVIRPQADYKDTIHNAHNAHSRER